MDAEASSEVSSFISYEQLHDQLQFSQASSQDISAGIADSRADRPPLTVLQPS